MDRFCWSQALRKDWGDFFFFTLLLIADYMYVTVMNTVGERNTLWERQKVSKKTPEICLELQMKFLL